MSALHLTIAESSNAGLQGSVAMSPCLLPGLIAASVWMTPCMGRPVLPELISRPVPLMTPVMQIAALLRPSRHGRGAQVPLLVIAMTLAVPSLAANGAPYTE